jgi:uncharacterized protein
MEKKTSKSPVRFMVLDVLKPHKPNIVELGKTLCEVQEMDSININVYAVDEKTESIKITLVGADIDFEKVKSLLEDNGYAVHSIDKVILGQKPFIEAQFGKKSE